MGKKERERKKAGQQVRASSGSRTAGIRTYMNEVLGSTPELRQIFQQEDSVPLTDELIQELVTTQGIPEKDLIAMREQGLLYCRPRNSFVGTPEIETY